WKLPLMYGQIPERFLQLQNSIVIFRREKRCEEMSSQYVQQRNRRNVIENKTDQYVSLYHIKKERICSLIRNHLVQLSPTCRRMVKHSGKASLRASLRKASIAV